MMGEASILGTVVIVDDDSEVREALTTLMQAAGHETRVFNSGEDLLESAIPDGAACLLLDLQLPGVDGIEIQQRLLDRGWNLPVLILTGHSNVTSAVTALKRGAFDYVEKCNLDPGLLLEQVASAIDKHRSRLCREAACRMLDERIATLSPRELEVARQAADGKTNKSIGFALGISERTVEVHRGRAMNKLGLRTVAGLARLSDRLNPDY
jgi:FixJ family two-component response regulator